MIKSKQGLFAEKGSKATSKTNSVLMLGWIPNEALPIACGIPDSYLLFSRSKSNRGTRETELLISNVDVRCKSAAYWWIATARAGQMRENTLGRLDEPQAPLNISHAQLNTDSLT